MVLLSTGDVSGLWNRVAPTIEHSHLTALDIRHLIDVGANRGQFIKFALAHFPDLVVDAFEPLPPAAAMLRRWLSSMGHCCTVHESAVGDEEGVAVLYQTQRDDSSSLLQPTPVQVGQFGTRVVGELSVRVTRLDGVLLPDDLTRPTLLKIDAQGGEMDVLRGATHLLGAIDHVYVECSFIELYGGQAFARDVVRELDMHGIQLRGVYNVLYASDRTCMQADLLFSRAGTF